MELKSCTIYKGVCVRNVAKKWTSNLPSVLQKKHNWLKKINCQSEGYTWAFSRSHGLLSLSCESLVAHHTQFWVVLFRYRNACENELTNLKIVEMKKQLPKWRMKSYGIVLFRNLTSLSFSSVSHNMSTSPYSICMKDELHLRNIFANLNIKCRKCVFTGFRVTHHHHFPTKIAQPQITPGSPWNGTQIGLRRRLMSKVSSRCAKLSEAKVLLVSERWIFLLKLRGAVRKPVKNGQNMSGGRWCLVFFRIGTVFFEYIYIYIFKIVYIPTEGGWWWKPP